MLYRITTLALFRYREGVRAPLYWLFAAAATAAAVAGTMAGSYVPAEGPRIAADIGAAAVSLATVAAAAGLAAGNVPRELAGGFGLILLSLPIRRGEYLLGSYLGIVLAAAVLAMAVAGIVLCGAGALAGRPVEAGMGLAGAALALLAARRRYGWRCAAPAAGALLLLGCALASAALDERRVLCAAVALAALEAAIVAAWACFFAAFTTPALTAILTAGIFVAGRSTSVWLDLPSAGSPGLEVARALSLLVPELHRYVPARAIALGEGGDLSGYLLAAAALALGWSAVLLVLGATVLRHRDPP